MANTGTPGIKRRCQSSRSHHHHIYTIISVSLTSTSYTQLQLHSYTTSLSIFDSITFGLSLQFHIQHQHIDLSSSRYYDSQHHTPVFRLYNTAFPLLASPTQDSDLEREKEGDSRCVVTKTAPAHHFSRWREIQSTLILSHCHTSSSQFPFPKLKVESSDLALTPFARPSLVTCYAKGPPFSLIHILRV